MESWQAQAGQLVRSHHKERQLRRDAATAEREARSHTIDRYLETIFYIDGEGEVVRASRIADWLGVSQPTAGATLQRMVRQGLVQISPASKVVSLSPAGRRAAERIVRRHRIAERWLTDVLGLDWQAADEEAGRLEHAMSDDVAERLYTLIGKPETCPHGNPIPGAAPRAGRERPLRELAAGKGSRIRRVSEVAEHDAPELLRFLAEAGLFLGVEVETISVSAGAGTQAVRVGDREVSLSLEVAGKIWVD